MAEGRRQLTDAPFSTGRETTPARPFPLLRLLDQALPHRKSQLDHAKNLPQTWWPRNAAASGAPSFEAWRHGATTLRSHERSPCPERKGAPDLPTRPVRCCSIAVSCA